MPSIYDQESCQRALPDVRRFDFGIGLRLPVLDIFIRKIVLDVFPAAFLTRAVETLLLKKIKPRTLEEYLQWNMAS